MNDYQSLLGQVALHERYEAGRRKPFNVFSVLRRESDEVNLHSRFLHALLDYRKSPEAERENLKDFLQHVAGEEFEEEGAKVERERYKIDILIRSADSAQAVGIENKIWAGDQPQQLRRYHKKLQEEGYGNIHLLYLTLHGNEPSEDSVGKLDYETISYKDDLLPWLERCQRRAYDEPELRESVSQYRQVIRKLTGTDLTEEYMSALKKLLLQGNNLVLAHDLGEAKLEVYIELLQKLWCEIDVALREEISDLPDKANKDSDLSPDGMIVSPDRIRKLVEGKKNAMWHGLYYPFVDRGAASLGVEIGNSILFGVRCHEDHKKERVKLEKALSEIVSNEKPTQWWPWFKYANGDLNLKRPTRENLELLSKDDGRRNYAQGIAQGLKEVWERVKTTGLAR